MPVIAAVLAIASFLFATSANAQLIEGCDPTVWQAMKDKAQARVLYDVGVTEEIIKKPDSTIALTCFDQAVAQSGTQGGSIFSGDFSADVGNVVDDAISDLLGNFVGSLMDDPLFGGILGGFLGGLLGFLGGGGGWGGCTNMQDLWDAVVLNNGINVDVPLISFNDLLAGAVAGAGANLTANLGAGGTIANLNASIAALPIPAVPSFAATQTLCDALNTAGLGPCP